MRYDSPTFGGFSVSASWGEDDIWDVAARYAGEIGGFKVAVAAAYIETSTDFNEWPRPNNCWLAARQRQFFQIGAYVEHVPRACSVYGAYGQLNECLASADDERKNFWYVKAGLRERWNPLGHTVLYGEYENSATARAPRLSDNGNLQLWGARRRPGDRRRRHVGLAHLSQHCRLMTAALV